MADFEVKEAWETAILALENLQLSSVGEGGLSHPVFLSGKSDIKSEKIDFALTAKSDFFGTLLTGQGIHDLKKSAGQVNLKIPSLEFEQDGLQPTDLVRVPMQDLKLAGRVAADIDMKWSQSGYTSKVVATLEDLDIQAGEGSVTGLSGTVHIDELDPLTISAVQELSADQITSAVILSQPLLRFRIGSNKGEPVLYVDDLKLGFVGGTASVKGAAIDTSAPTNSVRVDLSNLDLEKLMALGDVDGFTASGTLDGYIPLRFDGEELTIDTGVLETAGPGILQLKSERARQALARGGSQTKLLFDILENFQYSELGVQIRKKISGEDTISLHTKGSNPDVENNRPVVLNINLETNLGKILNTVLDGYLLSEKALRATVRNRSK
ncbi:MAG: YdbH domain-containing protein [Sneathiella sp.]